MAQPRTLWSFEEASGSVVIYNQGTHRYGRELWEELKIQEGVTDQELAEILNNFKP